MWGGRKLLGADVLREGRTLERVELAWYANNANVRGPTLPRDARVGVLEGGAEVVKVWIRRRESCVLPFSSYPLPRAIIDPNPRRPFVSTRGTDIPQRTDSAERSAHPSLAPIYLTAKLASYCNLSWHASKSLASSFPVQFRTSLRHLTRDCCLIDHR